MAAVILSVVIGCWEMASCKMTEAHVRLAHKDKNKVKYSFSCKNYLDCGLNLVLIYAADIPTAYVNIYRQIHNMPQVLTARLPAKLS